MASLSRNAFNVLVVLAVTLVLASYFSYTFLKVGVPAGDCAAPPGTWPMACYLSLESDSTCLTVMPHPWGCQSLDVALVLFIIALALLGSIKIYAAYAGE
ncbi:MAG TPA: hypothetical protein VJA40_02780 [archaeon]|nr:hypothetical protein [archaeon]